MRISLKRIELAWKMLMGYKLKTLSLFIFMTVSFTVIVGGFDLIVSSFNGFFSRQLTFMQPNYYVSGYKSFDCDVPNFGYKNQCLTEDAYRRIREELTDMRVFDGIYLPGMLAIRDQESRNQEVLTIGIDFAKARDIFPGIASQFSQEEMLAFKANRTVLIDSFFFERARYEPGQEVIYLTDNYYRSVNGIKMKSKKFIPPTSNSNFFGDFGIVWIDLDALALVGGIPEGRHWPLFAFTEAPVIGPRSLMREVGLRKALAPLNAAFVTPLTSMQEMRSSFAMLAVIFSFLGFVIVIIVIVSTSSNLFINFQNRKADFGLMKAFGFDNRDFFGLVFMENMFTLSIALSCAFGLNLALSRAFPSFVIIDFPCSLRVMPLCVALMLFLVVIVNLLSVIRPYAYLRNVDPVNIMKEE